MAVAYDVAVCAAADGLAGLGHVTVRLEWGRRKPRALRRALAALEGAFLAAEDEAVAAARHAARPVR